MCRMKDSSVRVALVTGANKGIGYHVARKLGAAGVHVLVGSRDAGRGEGAIAKLRDEGITAEALALDVTDAGSIERAAASVKAKHGRLDILVNNAGIARNSDPPSTCTVEDLRATFETNVFGVFATTNAFLPLLRLSEAPRIVNVSSGLGSLGIMTDPSSRWSVLNAVAYQSSKTALNAITVMYAKELAGTPFKVNIICPGFRATDLAGEGVNAANGAGDPAGGADIVVRMATLDADGPTGKYFADDGSAYPW